MRLLLFFFIGIVFFISRSFAQRPEDFKVIDIGNASTISSIELSPDAKTAAIATSGGFIYLWDIESKSVSRKIELRDYSQGPYMTYSNDGKYLLLQQQFYTDFALNKDRPSRAEVMEAESGKIVLSVNDAHTAALHPDNKSLVILRGSEVVFFDIASGKELRKFSPANVTNAMAISPSGNELVVSAKPFADDLRNIPSIREDKKAMKEAMKYREIAVFYDANTFEKKFMVKDIFDIVFSMHFSKDGSMVYLFNAPNTHLRAQQGAARNGYIQAVKAADGEPERVMYSTAATEPLFKESGDRKYFAVTSIEQRFRVLNSINLFDRESGTMLKNFINDFRITEDVHAGRASFEFLPGNENILLGYGSKLAIWKIN